MQGALSALPQTLHSFVRKNLFLLKAVNYKTLPSKSSLALIFILKKSSMLFKSK